MYAARKRDTGKLYAVKCMDKRLIKVRRATRLIVTERHVLASVDNPFITGLKYAFHNAQVSRRVPGAGASATAGQG